MSTRRVAILGGQRIPFARSFGKYMGATNQQLMEASLKALVDKFNLKGERLGTVALGSVIKHSSDWNLARECALGSGLSAETPAYDLVQACGTSLQTVISVANSIALGHFESGIAGGVDTNSDLPFAFSRHFNRIMLEANKERTTMGKLKKFLALRPGDLKPLAPGVVEPRTGMGMGESCEVMAKEWGITREAQDELAVASHKHGADAWKNGFYKDLVVGFNGLEFDDNLRGDTNMEKMAKLKPAFDRKAGTLTAANSTPLSDGSSCVLLGSEEWANKKGFPVLAYLSWSETAAVDFVKAEGLLMAPSYAVPRMLKRANLKLQDFDIYEIHEAFAAQVLCTLKAWESPEFCKKKLGLSEPLGKIDRSKMNLKGGSVALGHPFAATGARIVAGLAKQLNERGSGRGLISICTGGGMGVTAILEK